MPKLIVEEQKEFTLFPPDSILALRAEEQEIREVQGRYGPWNKLEIKFIVLGIVAIGDGGNPQHYEAAIGGPIWGSVPFRLDESPENKLRLWAEAIFNVDFGLGAEVDTDLFMGRECRGLTSQYKKREANPDGSPRWGHQIEALIRQGAPVPQQGTPPGYGQAPQGYGQPPQQGYAQPNVTQPQAPVQDPWANTPPPAPAQIPQPAQDPWSAPAATPAAQDPWAPRPDYEEPPF